MRFKFFLCASADLGVRRTNVSSSFCKAEYIGISENAQAATAAIRVPGRRSRPGSARRKASLQIVQAAGREPVGVEVIVSVRLRFHGTERGKLRRLTWQFEIEAVHQLVICHSRYANGEPCLEGSNTRNGPAVEQLASGSGEFSKRQFPVVAENNAVAGVER